MATSALRNTSKRRQWSNRDKAFRNDQNTRRRNNCARRLFRLMAGGVTASPFTGVNRAARRADAKFLAELETAEILADSDTMEALAEADADIAADRITDLKDRLDERGLEIENWDPSKESIEDFIQKND